MAEPPMPHAEYTITVSRPQKDVFDYLAEGTHNREWRAEVLEIRRTSAADGEGATYRQVLVGPGGRRIDGDYQITVFDPLRRLEFQVTAGPARPAGVFELSENADQSTRVRFNLGLPPRRVHEAHDADDHQADAARAVPRTQGRGRLPAATRERADVRPT